MVRGFAARGRTRAGTLAHVGDVAFDAFGTSPGADARARRFARARSAPRRRSDARGSRVGERLGWGLLLEQAAEDVYGVLLELVECRGGGGGVARGAGPGSRVGFGAGLGTPADARAAAWARAGRRGATAGAASSRSAFWSCAMKFLAPSKDFTPSPEAVRARLGGGAPAGASARAATVATAAGTAAGSGPRFSSGEAPGASSREDGAALDERRCLGTTNITRERRGRADDVGLGARRRRGFPPRRATTRAVCPRKTPVVIVDSRRPRRAGTVTDDGRREHARDGGARCSPERFDERRRRVARSAEVRRSESASEARNPGVPSCPRADESKPSRTTRHGQKRMPREVNHSFA